MGDTRRILRALGLGPARLAAGPQSALAYPSSALAVDKAFPLHGRRDAQGGLDAHIGATPRGLSRGDIGRRRLDDFDLG
jgi:hypothetical protein